MKFEFSKYGSLYAKVRARAATMSAPALVLGTFHMPDRVGKWITRDMADGVISACTIYYESSHHGDNAWIANFVRGGKHFIWIYTQNLLFCKALRSRLFFCHPTTSKAAGTRGNFTYNLRAEKPPR